MVFYSAVVVSRWPGQLFLWRLTLIFTAYYVDDHKLTQPDLFGIYEYLELPYTNMYSCCMYNINIIITLLNSLF